MWKSIVIKMAIPFLAVCMGWTSSFGQGQESPVSPYVKNVLCGGLEPGARIRFRINQDHGRESDGDQVDEKTITGTLQSCGDGMLVFKPEKSNSDLEHVPLDDVLWLQVSQGRSSYALPGAFVGLAAGIAISMASQTNRHEDEFLGGLEDAEENVSRGIAITAGTTLLGALIGYAAGSENWKSVYGENLSASLGSNRLGEYQLSVGYSF
jgi:hypothetical protein